MNIPLILYMKFSLKRALIFCALLIISIPLQALETFIANDISFEGLQRIDSGNLEQHLTLQPGSEVTPSKIIEQINVLYKTGFFNDISVYRDGDNIIIHVEERDVISEVVVDGNKAIKTENIMEAFESMGIKEGEVYDPLKLEKMGRELHALYSSHSKYNAKVDIDVQENEDGHRSVLVNIDEGKSSKIRAVNLVGNTVFKTDDLIKKMRLSTGGFFTFFTKSNEFSRQKLAADLETLRSYYMDRGYADFSIESVQVSIAADRKDIFITINVHEGKQYTVGDIVFQATSEFSDEEFKKALTVEEGQVFSRKKIIESGEKIRQVMGNKGYLFANVNTLPALDKDTNKTHIKFDVDAGKKIYVRNINFNGNNKTRDDVMRREMRQLEGAWIETDKVKRSKVRLQRLDYFKSVDVDTVPVKGVDDQVDLNFRVQEKPSAAFIGGIGFSQAQGFLVNASVQQKNFLGTGDTVGLNINNSNVNRVYSANYTNPYYTIDGVSRGFRLFSRQTDAGAVSVADFLSDNFGGSVSFGIPVSEFSTANISFTAEHQSLTKTGTTPQEFIDFIDANASDFNLYRMSMGISYDSRNRVVFAEKGILSSASADWVMPGSGLTYYKINLRQQWKKTYWKPFTFSLKGNIAYGGSYSETTELPFFERFFSGGTQSVRGYRSNSLGPRTALDNRPMGGAFKVVGNAEIIFPPPFTEDNSAVRLALFLDMGNVYDNINSFDAGELRFSTGLSIVWLSPLGPLSVSFASALNAATGDETETFQFSLGTLF